MSFLVKCLYSLDALALTVIFAPILGGLVAGLDRKLTARVQSRMGPPVLQPFYDVAKLLGKENIYGSIWQPVCAFIYFFAAFISVLLFFLQADLLLIFFVQAAGAVFLVIGALAIPSPYSQVGAQRELLQLLAYEPLLLLVLIGIALETGDFNLGAAYSVESPLLFKLPLLYLALSIVFTIKLRKSPFDISGSHHAHQELVKGVFTEYSGPHLALIEMAHWYETVLLLGICSLFWSTSVLGMILLPLITYVAEIFIDNACARLTWRWMLASVLGTGMALSCVNLIWHYAK